MLSLKKDATFDFIIKISKNVVSCFLKQEQKGFSFAEEVVDIPFTLSSSLAENFQILTNAIKEAIFVSEAKILKRLERAILLIDFGNIQKKTVKFKTSEEFNFANLQETLQEKFENKIVSISFQGIKEGFRIFEVLSVSKSDTQMLLNIVSSVGIEISEVTLDFKFIIEKISSSSNLQNFVFLKFSNDLLEVGEIKKGSISKYQSFQEFGFNAICNELESLLHVNSSVLIKLLKFYNTSSKVDRLRNYYERESEDFEIKSLIENTGLILNLQNSLKKIMEKIISELKLKEEVQALYFRYSGHNEFLNLHQFKLHEFANIPVNIYEFSSFYEVFHEENNSNVYEQKIPMVGVVAKQMKKFFYLTS